MALSVLSPPLRFHVARLKFLDTIRIGEMPGRFPRIVFGFSGKSPLAVIGTARSVSGDDIFVLEYVDCFLSRCGWGMENFKLRS